MTELIYILVIMMDKKLARLVEGAGAAAADGVELFSMMFQKNPRSLETKLTLHCVRTVMQSKTQNLGYL